MCDVVWYTTGYCHAHALVLVCHGLLILQVGCTAVQLFVGVLVGLGLPARILLP